MRILALLIFSCAQCFSFVMPGVNQEPKAVAPGLYGGTTACVMWFNRNGLTNYSQQAADGSTVGAWKNNIPWNHSCDLSNSIAAPRYTNNAFGGIPKVCCVAASSMFLQTSNIADVTMLGGTNFSWVILCQTNTFTPAFTLAALAPTNSIANNSTEWYDGGPANGPECDFGHGSPQATWRTKVFTNNIRGMAINCIVAATIGVATNDVEIRINSLTDPTNPPDQSNGNPGSFTEAARVLYLGGRANRGSFGNLNLSEFLLYNKKLSGGERFFLEQFLRRVNGDAKVP